MKKINKNSGFTLVELLVVIFIIAILATLAIVSMGNVRIKARDTRRIADIKQIGMALDLYYNDNGSYPSAITPGSSLESPAGDIVYMSTIPSNPNPRSDGGCEDTNYVYTPVNDNTSYNLEACLGGVVANISNGGTVVYTPSGFVNSQTEVNDVFALNYIAGENGSITGTSPQTVNQGENGSVVTAVPDEGYYFVNWSDDVTANPRIDINITTNISVTANFAANLAFSCGDDVAYDSRNYSTVQIGTQCWFAENLNYGTRINGNINQSNANAGVIEKYCYDNNIANCVSLGALYQWHTAMAFPQICDDHNGSSPCSVNTPHQGICPSGWHVPSDSEWTILTRYVSGIANCNPDNGCAPASTKLKSVEPAWDGTDNYNFSAIPSGYRGNNGNFTHDGSRANFWTDLTDDDDKSYRRYLNNGDAKVNRNDDTKLFGYSVRCIKD